MKSPLAFVLVAAALPLSASSIDVTRADSVLLHSGDTLSFTLQTFSYARNAQTFGLSPIPASLLFSLVTTPTTQSAGFAVTLSSADASYDVALDAPLGFTAAGLGSSKYRGAVSALSASFSFTGAESDRLFSGSVAHLNFRNLGGDVTLGLSGLLLPQDLYSSLSGDRLTVGALAISASLQEPSCLSSAPGAFSLQAPPPAAVPEPSSAVLLLGGGALICAFSLLLRRLSRARTPHFSPYGER
ncbi:MAG: PEP-CTERM sorting domain-containing protein [Acidobacteriota bacterium]|nr:PEP-CTERM sorting domain-containing protein [Acidobacteriota bacterium]